MPLKFATEIMRLKFYLFDACSDWDLAYFSQVECSGGFSNRPESGITFQRVWELTEESDQVHVFGPNDKDLQKSRRARIAKYVATTNEVGHVWQQCIF